ncbi:MAG: DUF4870 domain-containing protein [Bacteroidia bacterium]
MISNYNQKNFVLLIHLTQFAGYVLPLAGLIVPVIMWFSKKDEDQIIDLHGRIVINWIITEIILLVVAVPLTAILIGFPFLIAIGICGIAFPIIGALKASEYQTWPYPLSIDFMGVKQRINDKRYN